MGILQFIKNELCECAPDYGDVVTCVRGHIKNEIINTNLLKVKVFYANFQFNQMKHLLLFVLAVVSIPADATNIWGHGPRSSDTPCDSQVFTFCSNVGLHQCCNNVHARSLVREARYENLEGDAVGIAYANSDWNAWNGCSDNRYDIAWDNRCYSTQRQASGFSWRFHLPRPCRPSIGRPCPDSKPMSNLESMKQIIAKMVLVTVDGMLFVDHEVAYSCAREFNKMNSNEEVTPEAYIRWLDNVKTRTMNDMIHDLHNKGYTVYQREESGKLVSVHE